MMEFRCWRREWSADIAIAVVERLQDGLAVGKPFVMEALPKGMPIPGPTMVASNDEAQFLMDELWRCGLRPTEGSGSAGSLAATERHLADMRSIAIGLLRKGGVQL